MIPRRVSDFSGEWRESSGDQRNYKHCPVCHSASWKVFVDPKQGKWVCFGGRHPQPPHGGYPGGNLEVEADGEDQGRRILEMLEPDAPQEWGEIELPDYKQLSGMAVWYLSKRGITMQLARSLGIVEWSHEARILIPYFDRSGRLIYWNSRRYSEAEGEGPKYVAAPGRHPLYIPLDYNSCGSGAPVIVEGVFDAIQVAKAGYKAIALGGKSLPRYLRDSLLTEVRGCDIIYVLLDADAMAHATRLAQFLTSKPGVQDVRVCVCPGNQDPGDMTPDEIREVLK